MCKNIGTKLQRVRVEYPYHAYIRHIRYGRYVPYIVQIVHLIFFTYYTLGTLHIQYGTVHTWYVFKS
jgi:hypothetical protein